MGQAPPSFSGVAAEPRLVLRLSMLVLGLVLILGGLAYYLGSQLGLPRGPYKQDEQKRVAVRRSAPILLGLGLIITTVAVMGRLGWINWP